MELMHNSERAELEALRKDVETFRWMLSRLKAYDIDGPELVFSWPYGVDFNFGAPIESIHAAMDEVQTLESLHNAKLRRPKETN